jgi:hypothetical protein
MRWVSTRPSAHPSTYTHTKHTRAEASVTMPTHQYTILVLLLVPSCSRLLPTHPHCAGAQEMRYDARRRMGILEQVWTSQASATQRAGRAGRVREGVCFRLCVIHNGVSAACISSRWPRSRLLCHPHPLALALAMVTYLTLASPFGQSRLKTCRCLLSRFVLPPSDQRGHVFATDSSCTLP